MRRRILILLLLVSFSTLVPKIYATIDTTPPQIRCYPDQKPVWNSTYYLHGMAVDESGIESLYVNGEDVNATKTEIHLFWVKQVTLTNGVNIFNLTAVDNLGNKSNETVTVTYTPDQYQGPTIKLIPVETQPQNNASISCIVNPNGYDTGIYLSYANSRNNHTPFNSGRGGWWPRMSGTEDILVTFHFDRDEQPYVGEEIDYIFHVSNRQGVAYSKIGHFNVTDPIYIPPEEDALPPIMYYHAGSGDIPINYTVIEGSAWDENQIKNVTINGYNASGYRHGEHFSFYQILELSSGDNFIETIAYDNSPNHNMIKKNSTLTYQTTGYLGPTIKLHHFNQLPLNNPVIRCTINPMGTDRTRLYLKSGSSDNPNMLFGHGRTLGSEYSGSQDLSVFYNFSDPYLDVGDNITYLFEVSNREGWNHTGISTFTVTEPDHTPPTVISTNPSQNQFIENPTTLSIKYNEPIDPFSNITLKINNNPITTSISYSEHYTRIHLEVNQLPDGPIDVEVIGATDLANNPIGAYTWSFTNGSPVNWNSFHGDHHNTGYSPINLKTTLTLIDEINLGGGRYHKGPPVFQNNTCYVSCYQTLYAIDLETNTINWSFDLTEGGLTDRRGQSAPAVNGDIVIVNSWDNVVFGLNSTTGELLWRYESQYPVLEDAHAGYFINPSSTIVNNTVYIGLADGAMHALDLQTGNNIWLFNTTADIKSTPAYYNGSIYFGSGHGGAYHDDHLYKVNASSGELLNSITTQQDIESSPTIYNDTVYFGVSNNIYALDAENLATEWTTNIPTGNYIESSPAVNDDYLVITGGDWSGDKPYGDIYCLNRSTGEILWQAGENYTRLTPVITGDLVWIGEYTSLGDKGSVHVHNITNGDLLYEYETELNIVPVPGIYKDKVYFMCLDGYLRSFSTNINLYQVSGTVYYSNTPLDNVTLDLLDYDTSQILRTTQSTNGSYSFTSLPEGTYWLKAYGPTTEYRPEIAWKIELINNLNRDIYLPKLFELQSPADKSKIKTKTPLLEWEPYIDASYYTISIHEIGNWTENSFWITNITGTSYRIESDLEPGKEYSWSVYAYNSEDNLVGTVWPWWSFNITDTITMDFIEGWNLVAFPYGLPDKTINNIFKKNITNVETIFTYDKYTKEWQYWIETLPEQLQTLTHVEDGWGYWIKVSEDFRINLP